MAIYMAEFTGVVGVNAADGVLWNLKAAASDRLKLLMAAFFDQTNPTNAPQFGIKRMNAVGTGTITLASAFQMDPNDVAPSGGLEVAWVTTRPTVTGGSAINMQVPATVGNGVLFDCRSSPIIISASGGLCGVMRNASGATVGALGGFVMWDE